jgi:hypothetical protein
MVLGAEAHKIVELGRAVMCEVDFAMVDLEPEPFTAARGSAGAVPDPEGHFETDADVAGAPGHRLDVEPLLDDVVEGTFTNELGGCFDRHRSDALDLADLTALGRPPAQRSGIDEDDGPGGGSGTKGLFVNGLLVSTVAVFD